MSIIKQSIDEYKQITKPIILFLVRLFEPIRLINIGLFMLALSFLLEVFKPELDYSRIYFILLMMISAKLSYLILLSKN